MLSFTANTSKLAPASYFTLFSSAHSLIIGLLPFFLPVLIWQQNQQLATLTEFVSWTGAGYAGAIFLWHKLFTQQHWKGLIYLSFVFELSLIYIALFHLTSVSMMQLGLLNGLFNCCYWMVQRVLFDRISSQSNTGRLFGNLQLFLGFSLKTGILIGGYFMQTQPWLILLLSALAALAFLYVNINNIYLHDLLYGHTPPSESTVPDVNASNQKQLDLINAAPQKLQLSWREKLTFIVDGPFLYLESYLWILSIFHLTNNNTEQFSLTIIVLSLTLGVIFYFVKNTIDKQAQQRLYQVTILLYALSWFVRGCVTADWHGFTISLTLLAIAFATALFRLYFNKRFYDIAKQQDSYQYILSKSIYSQVSICLFFASLTLLLNNDINLSLHAIYWGMAPLTFIYLFYLQHNKKTVEDEPTLPMTLSNKNIVK